MVEADELRDAIVALDQNELIAIAVALATLDQQPSREVEIATDAMICALNRAVFEAAGLPTPVVLKIFRRRPEFLETFDLSGIGILDVIDLLDLTAQPTAVANIFGRILSETASHAARAAVERYPAAAFAQAIRCASIGLLHPDWTRVFGRLTEKILPDGLRLFAGGSKQAALGLRVLDYPIQGSPPATVWFDVLGDALEGDVSQDRSTIDAFLVALCLRDGVAGTITIILKTLPRLRFMAVNGALPFEAEKLLDVHLPSVSDGWDFNKRLLKILRKANRDGADIEAGIAGMMLTKDEINYIYNQGDEKSFPFSLPSFIWPWR